MKRKLPLTEAASVRYGTHLDPLLITSSKTDVATHQTGAQPIATTQASAAKATQNNIPVVRVGDVTAGRASARYIGPVPSPPMKFLAKRGDIVVSMSGQFNINRWADNDALLDQRVMRVRGLRNSTSTDYLFHCLVPVLKAIEQQTVGHRTKNLSAKQVKQITVDLPAFNQQKRIAAILDAFKAAVDNFRRQTELRRLQLEYYRNLIASRTANPTATPSENLTTFNNYIANLDRQTTLRQQQYEYYRDLLLFK